MCPTPNPDTPETALAELFPEVLAAPVPPRLLQAARGPKNAARSPWWKGWRPDSHWLLPGLRVALVFGLGIALGWLAHDPLRPGIDSQPGMQLPREAALAHVNFSPDILGPDTLDPSQQDAKAAWLAKELALPVPPPRLDAQGYTLIGARRLGDPAKPVTQFMYHNARGQRLTLYVRAATTVAPSQDAGEFNFAEEGPVAVAYWTAGAFSFAVSAGLDRPGIMGVSRLARAQLSSTRDPLAPDA